MFLTNIDLSCLGEVDSDILGLWHGMEGKGVLGVTQMELQVPRLEFWERTNNVNTHYYKHAIA